MELSYQQATQLHFEALREAGTRGSFPGGLSLTQQEKFFHSENGFTVAVYEEHGLAGLLSLLSSSEELSAVTYLRYHHYSEYLIATLVNSFREVASQEAKEFALTLPQQEARHSRTVSHIWPAGRAVRTGNEFLAYYPGNSEPVPIDPKLVGFLETLQSSVAPHTFNTSPLTPLRGSLPL